MKIHELIQEDVDTMTKEEHTTFWVIGITTVLMLGVLPAVGAYMGSM